jgi:hypothetical protein
MQGGARSAPLLLAISGATPKKKKHVLEGYKHLAVNEATEKARTDRAA